MGIAVRSGLAGAALCVLAACGGGGGGSSVPVNPGNPGGGTFTPGLFPARTTFENQCITPRAGSSDRAGTAFTEKMFLRSWTNELYLWYNEVPDINPASIANVTDYFDALITPQTTPSGNDKDRFHFFLDTDAWIALSQSGQSIGYGAEFVIIPSTTTPTRQVLIAFVEPGTPANTAPASLARGMEVLLADGVDVVTANTQTQINTLNAAFFPTTAGSSHTFRVRPFGGATRDVTITSANITHTPVLATSVIDQGGVKVGYILFNDHIATAESQLITAVNTLKAANVQDLILDIRYNGGGFLDLANELAFMIAGPGPTTGMVFERLVFNSKNPTRDPITGELLAPGTLFESTTAGLPGSGVTPGVALPTLGLNRVYVITGPNTCSASESIINGLRGVGVQVFQIGSTTCGKPYGFYAQDNCSTTYFSIQFQGVNAMGDGEYPDGFTAQNQTTGRFSIKLAGCSVADDFTKALGDSTEGRLQTALAFRAGGNSNASCPTASGFAPGAQLKPGPQALSSVDGQMYKSPLRENRILR